ncbi:hypothetical protein G6F66_013689 [Rhizopus arrhizus]|nr:hypothetical protein G6F66_013689 [Rhizopus arrhizus]
MASADRVEIDVRVWPLLRGSVQLPEVRLTRPDVLLQTAPRKGEPGNWDFLGDSAGGPGPQLKRLRIDDGRLQFLDALGRTDIRLDVRSGQPKQADAAPPLLVQGKGRWQGNPFTLRGGTESPLQLTDSDHPSHSVARTWPTCTRCSASPFRPRRHTH